MFNLNDFLQKLDLIYSSGRTKEAEGYLTQGLKEATASGNHEGILAILNELIGYYRTSSRYEECIRCIDQAVQLAKAMGLAGTLNYGTMLLNAATGYRAAGQYKEAEVFYREAYDIFTQFLSEPDYRMASLHNNLSILYGETGRLCAAKEELLLAMDMIQKLDSAEAEIAITHTNLGSICFQMNQISEGTDHMKEAIRIFEHIPGNRDSHYASALAGLGEAYYHGGDLEQSAAFYEKALSEIEKNYGENEYYHVTQRNLQTVKDLQKRKIAFQSQSMTGMEIAKAYYEAYGKPMLRERYPEYADRIAAGLAGEGSECLGFDDFYSTDHDYGPGFCLWLEKEDYEAIGKQLSEDYARLPKEFMGLPARNISDHGQDRVGVFETGSFYQRLTGYEKAPEAHGKWYNIPSEALRSATNGEVFEDRLGAFTKQREAYSAYPETVRLKRLALALGKMAQAGQYNYGRSKKRRDTGAMYFSLSEFMDGAAEAAYLLNGSYMPFYKWRMRGMEEFTVIREIKTMLEELMALAVSDESVEEKIETVCGLVLDELIRQELSSSRDSFLEQQKAEVWRRAEDIEKKTAEGKQMNRTEQTGSGEQAGGSGQMNGKAEGSKAEGSKAQTGKRVQINGKEQMIDEIIRLEWKQFQGVKNEGGRASCQDDYDTFVIMRKSQFLTWDEEVVESYLEDLNEAEKENWNLLTEKYARMMESAVPDQYAQLADELPKRDEERIRLQEEIITQEMRWADAFAHKYPNLGTRGRKLRTSEDSPWDTSAETYLRGELGTYSDRTLALYYKMIFRLKREGRNLRELNLSHMTKFYGYQSLERAEERGSI